MTTAIALLNDPDHGLTVVDSDSGPLILAAGLATKLGYPRTSRLLDLVEPDEQGWTMHEYANGMQRSQFVTLSGMLRALGKRSADRIPDPEMRKTVEDFQNWVYRDVMPRIVTQGSYLTPEQRRKAALMSLTIDRALDNVRGALAAHKYGSVEMHLDDVHRANVYALRRYAGAEALKAASKELTANPYILDQE
jgi:prophage antirepressor-like protein